jgi:hypothetical protein
MYRAVLVLMVTVLLLPTVPTAAGAAPARENATFLYQPFTAQDLPSVGAPKLMVLTETASAGAARAAGLRAYKYLQFNWFPATGPWNGTTAAQRSQWRLCGPSGTPVGDGTSPAASAGTPTSTSLIRRRDARLRPEDEGPRLLFLHRRQRRAARPRSKTLSTCTGNPVTWACARRARTLLLGKVRALGLRLAINYPSPFADPLLRPAPTGTSTVNDLRPIVDFVLHENAASVDFMPFADLLSRLFGDAQWAGGKVIEMAKSQRRPDSPGKSQNERSVWALAKLAGQPVVLNTGNDLCAGAGRVPGGCLRMGLAPDLVNLQLGAPIDPLPRGADCSALTWTCAWFRRFQSGFVVYNPNLDAKVRKVSLSVTADGSCRQVNEVRGRTSRTAGA